MVLHHVPITVALAVGEDCGGETDSAIEQPVQ